MSRKALREPNVLRALPVYLVFEYKSQKTTAEKNNQMKSRKLNYASRNYVKLNKDHQD